MHVVRAVTTRASFRQRCLLDADGVAGVTGELCVPCRQSELPVARVIEARFLPSVVAVTGIALWTEAAGVHVIRAMAATAFLRHRFFEIAGAMATAAGHLRVGTQQREARLRVIELRRAPTRRRMAVRTRSAATAAVHVVSRMTACTLHWRVAVARPQVAARTSRLLVLPRQRKFRLRMIEPHRRPSRLLMTRAAIFPERAPMRILLAVAVNASHSGRTQWLALHVTLRAGHVHMSAM